jgi:hypothetical protein
MDTIVSCGVGGWHPDGVARLEASLAEHWSGNVMVWKNEWPPMSPPHPAVPYAFKYYAIEAARAAGHARVLWCDASVWALRDPSPVFGVIAGQGYYLWDSGWECDQWCNDRILRNFGIERAAARQMPMISAGIMGLDFEHPTAREFFRRWCRSMDRGDFLGSWTRDETEGTDPRYLGHRHDQAAASLIAAQLGMRLDRSVGLCAYYRHNDPETVLTCQGM